MSAQERIEYIEFQSTPSVWRATETAEEILCRGYISIHALRVEGDGNPIVITAKITISIHALRVEGDVTAQLYAVTQG